MAGQMLHFLVSRICQYFKQWSARSTCVFFFLVGEWENRQNFTMLLSTLDNSSRALGLL